MAVEGAGSWAEMVRAIDSERKRLPWRPEDVQPTKAQSVAERKRQERELDPIVMKYRDPAREENFSMTRTQSLMNKTHSKNLHTFDKFNIITHQGPPRKFDANKELLTTKHASKTRDWNLLSHLKHEHHAIAPILCSNIEALEELKRPAPRHSEARAGEREYNILNERFHKNDTARRQAEYDEMKDHYLKKYWDTHDYDFVKMQYLDPQKEEAYRDQRQYLSTIQGRSQLLRIPPSVLQSEGSSYNIVNNTVKNEDQLRTTLTIDNRSLSRMKRSGVEQFMKSRSMEKEDLDDARRLGKISYKRWEVTQGRGFDPIKNIRKDVEDNKPLAQRASTVWSQLQVVNGDGNSFNNSVTVEGYPQNDNSRLIDSGSGTNGGIANATGTSTSTGRRMIVPRDLSGAAEQAARTMPNVIPASTYSNQLVPQTYTAAEGSYTHLQRAQTSMPFHQNTTTSLITDNNPSFTNRESARSRKSVPSSFRLDLKQAEAPVPVKYVEPQYGPPGLPVMMTTVRTGGGLSSMRN